MGRRSQKLGEIGERAARYVLEQMGFAHIERIHTGWKLIRWVDPRRRLARVVPVARVSGDFRAVQPPDGRSVLVEVKQRERDRLLYSDFKDHQTAALSVHAAAGGLSLVVWVRPDGGQIDTDADVFVLQWPIPGFGSRRPLSWESARNLDVSRYGFPFSVNGESNNAHEKNQD